jgi:hypothetical protein
MNFNKTGKVFTSKFVGTGPSSYKKKNLLCRGLIRLRTTALDHRGGRSGKCGEVKILGPTVT